VVDHCSTVMLLSELEHAGSLCCGKQQQQGESSTTADDRR
jgi:hypothetical protein